MRIAHKQKEGWGENTGCYKTVLIKEMRLNLGEEFIEAHNEQFGKAAKDPQNGHRPLNPKEDLGKILATRSERCISKSLSIQYNNQIYQLQTEIPNRLRYKKL